MVGPAIEDLAFLRQVLASRAKRTAIFWFDYHCSAYFARRNGATYRAGTAGASGEREPYKRGPYAATQGESHGDRRHKQSHDHGK